MTELAALNVKITGDSGGLTAAVTAAKTQLGGLTTAVTAAEAKAGGLGAAFGGMGKRISGSRGQIQQVSFQLQDMAVQFAAGTRASTVFAQQGSQILSVFGPVGAVLGTVAAIALPVLAAALMSSGESAKTFKEALDAVTESISTLKDTAAAFTAEGLAKMKEQYGELNNELLYHIELQRQVDMRAALVAAQEAAAALKAEMAGWTSPLAQLQQIFPDIAGKVNLMYFAVEKAQGAKTFQEQVVALTDLRNQILSVTGGIENMTAEQFAFFQKVQDSLDAMMQLNSAAPPAGWLNGAIAGAQSLGTALWDAVSAKIALANTTLQPATGTFTSGGMDAAKSAATGGLGGSTRPSGAGLASPKGGGGGGGGGTEDSIKAELEALQESLMSQEQLQLESYQRQQELLSQALAQRLITQEEYQSLMQQAQATHDFAMTQSVNKGVTGTLNALGSLFQGSKKISAAIAVANSWLAFTEVLKDPSFVGRPWARVAAAGQALAAGLNAVKNIKSASPGGGGGSGGRGGGGGMEGGAPTQQSVQTLNFTVQNDSFGIGQNLIRQIAAQLNEAQRNGSTLIRATVA